MCFEMNARHVLSGGQIISHIARRNQPPIHTQKHTNTHTHTHTHTYTHTYTHTHTHPHTHNIISQQKYRTYRNKLLHNGHLV